jgi:hypothetical protein
MATPKPTDNTPVDVVKMFAAPGIDSDVLEWGVYSSGAGLHPSTPTSKVPPSDWLAVNPDISHATGKLVGNFDATKAQDPRGMRVRRRGISSWGGLMPGSAPHAAGPTDVRQGTTKFRKSGGIVDTNLGASGIIAGGPGQASSMVRLSGQRKDSGMKLPQLPNQVARGGKVAFPAGGMHGLPPAPLIPKIPGLAGIIRVVQAKQATGTGSGQ